MPRLLFEDWTYDDFRNVLDSEDEIEELSKTVVQVAKVKHVGVLASECRWGSSAQPPDPTSLDRARLSLEGTLPLP